MVLVVVRAAPSSDHRSSGSGWVRHCKSSCGMYGRDITAEESLSLLSLLERWLIVLVVRGVPSSDHRSSSSEWVRRHRSSRGMCGGGITTEEPLSGGFRARCRAGSGGGAVGIGRDMWVTLLNLLRGGISPDRGAHSLQTSASSG